MADGRVPSSKAPLRGIGKLFTNLNAGVRTKLESAFIQTEDFLDYHNNSVVQKQTRRKLSGLLETPIITVDQNVLGFIVSWARLNDRRITMYEVQIAPSNNFADPTTYQTVDHSFSLEGIGSTVYVRVRGIRGNAGETSSWSDTETIIPQSSAPIVHSAGFDDVEPFYIDNTWSAFPDPILRLTITQQRQNGGIFVVGSYGSNFYYSSITHSDHWENLQLPLPADELSVRLNGRKINGDESLPYGAFWRLGTILRVGPTGAELGFVTTPIGYSTGFGPAYLSHDQFYLGFNDLTPNRTESLSEFPTGSGIKVPWTLSGATGSLPALIDLDPVFIVTKPKVGRVPDYSSISNLTQLQSGLNYALKGTNFGFNIPTDRTVFGIQMRFLGSYTTTSNLPPRIFSMSLIDDGVARASIASGTETWPTGSADLIFPWTSQFNVYGNDTYHWGEAPGFWTPAKINKSTFGVEIWPLSRGSSTPGTTATTVYCWGFEIAVWTDNPQNTGIIEVYVNSSSDVINGFTGQPFTSAELQMRLNNICINAIEFGDVIP